MIRITSNSSFKISVRPWTPRPILCSNPWSTHFSLPSSDNFKSSLLFKESVLNIYLHLSLLAFYHIKEECLCISRTRGQSVCLFKPNIITSVFFIPQILGSNLLSVSSYWAFSQYTYLIPSSCESQGQGKRKKHPEL